MNGLHHFDPLRDGIQVPEPHPEGKPNGRAKDAPAYSDDRPSLVAQPLQLPAFDTIPPRPWLLGRRFQLGQITVPIAPPGGGKSSDTLVSALSVQTGRSLTGETVYEHGNVWYISNEEPLVELHRRIAALCLHYNIDPAELNGRMLLNSGLDGPGLVIAREVGGTIVATPDVDAIVEQIRQHDIKLLIVDPFLSTHEVNENDNAAINAVVTLWLRIATITGAAVVLPHHTRKPTGASSDGHVGNPDSSRGAGALIAKARVAYTLAEISEADAAAYGIPAEERNLYVRADRARNTYTVRQNGVPLLLYRWRTVTLPNAAGPYEGDQIGVLEPVPIGPLQARKAEQDEIIRDRVLTAVAGALEPGAAEFVSNLADTINNQCTFKGGRDAIRELIKQIIPDGARGAVEVRTGTIACRLFRFGAARKQQVRREELHD